MKHIRPAHHACAIFQPYHVELLPPRVHDTVLEPGFHYKHVSSPQEASDLLASMSTFGRSVGLLTVDPHVSALTEFCKPRDLLAELSATDMLAHEELLAHWLATCCSYDSIMIDASDELLQSDWFGPLEAALTESGCSNRMPVFFLFHG